MLARRPEHLQTQIRFSDIVCATVEGNGLAQTLFEIALSGKRWTRHTKWTGKRLPLARRFAER